MQDYNDPSLQESRTRNNIEEIIGHFPDTQPGSREKLVNDEPYRPPQ